MRHLCIVAALFFLPLAAQNAVPAAPSIDRVIEFPGFAAHTLKGSVRAGGTHAFFAVLVAGSGPTDRDWSNPLMGRQSHGGKDLALWLQGQGLGSLRFDKRTVGSKDPKLDRSIEAVSGDVRAAVKAARVQPEAKGKRILLVGHSEGTLLSLLVAQEADALLLLAMPGKSMGRLILDQVRRQFEMGGTADAITAANMDYLARSVDALKKGREIPAETEGVLPPIAGLAKSLSVPESRGFLQGILDLDPWEWIGRLKVPFAAAWGDRDVQCPKPRIPEGFRGAVIDLPGANHLLKRETRPLSALAGMSAMEAYGDDTPLADLGPLAAWLKELAPGKLAK